MSGRSNQEVLRNEVHVIEQDEDYNHIVDQLSGMAIVFLSEATHGDQQTLDCRQRL